MKIVVVGAGEVVRIAPYRDGQRRGSAAVADVDPGVGEGVVVHADQRAGTVAQVYDVVKEPQDSLRGRRV